MDFAFVIDNKISKNYSNNMNQRNEEIKKYIQDFFASEDDVQKFARENSQAHGLPDIHVPSHVGKFLYLLTKLRAPRKVLEIGTLGGYSTIWIAKGMTPLGHLISLEIEPSHARLAKEHIAKAGYEGRVEIRVGKAAELLSAMIDNREGPFDLIFIDADKENYPSYLEPSLALSTSGTLILSDNLIPKGEEINHPKPSNLTAQAVYRFNQQLSQHPRLESVLTTTIVRDNGRIDALGISLVK